MAIKGGDNERTFSLASSLQEKGPIMVAMRMRETGFKTALNAAPNGTMFKVSSPRGSFTLHEDFARPAYFWREGLALRPCVAFFIRWFAGACRTS